MDGPILIGDVGGTNARFALLAAPEAPMVALPRVLTADFPDPTAAIRSILPAGGPAPRSAMIAVATKIQGPRLAMTNSPWTVDAREIAADLGLRRVELFNDFAPVAAALSALPLGGNALVCLGPDLAPGPGPRLALGPGTGFGAAALVPVGERWTVVPTEAGHVEFGPAKAAEAEVWRGLDPVHGRVTAEAVLSGPGIVRLYRAVARAHGTAAPLVEASEVTAAGLAGQDAVAAATLDLFATLLGRFAGDLALIFGAAGGVYLAGGIAPRLVPVLAQGAFRTAFDSKAPFHGWAAQVPTYVITHPDPALEGLALLARERSRFVVESWASDAL